MQKQTSLYIPKPCHEDWNKMTPTQQGKFCSACSKQVIDFSLMSDNQILNFLSHQSGKLCGRFDAEQLQRPLVETKIKKKKSWWMALTIPLLFLFERSEAQENYSPQIDTAVSPIKIQPEIMGKLVYHPMKQITITGKVLDIDNKPISYATIGQKGTHNATTSDSLGNFSIGVGTDEDSITLTTSCVGFLPVEKSLKLSDKNTSGVIINMKEQLMGLSDVVVTSKVPFYGRLGGAVAICTRITVFEKIDSSFKKAIGISNIYPNPVLRGNSIHLKMKNASNYQMQLLDIKSRLIQTEEINAASDNSTEQIQLPSNIAAGVYYLRMINEQTKKSYTEKLIIQ